MTELMHTIAERQLRVEQWQRARRTVSTLMALLGTIALALILWAMVLDIGYHAYQLLKELL